jgi:acetyltransferase-like isoleucine patch superfamily enzyme
LTTPEFHGLPVVAMGEATRHFPPDEILAFAPMGAARMNEHRREKYEALKALGYHFFSYVHSSNHGAAHCAIGENCLILENQSLNFDSAIGDNVVMWSGCQLGDRSRVGSHSYLGAHVVINGDAVIGEASYLGSNCTISHGVQVGPQSFIGANALISDHTAASAVHVVPSTPALEIDSLRFMKLLRAPL